MALKSGTAINLTVFNLPRLSVDIDLDFSENLPREEMQARRDRISTILERYMTAEGYRQKGKSKRTFILDSFVYSYTNAAGNADNIKVEINYALRCHVLPTVALTALTIEMFEPFPIQTLAPVEIFASKIVAMSSRAAARDLYDLNNMVYYSLFDEADLIMLRKCVVFYWAIAGDVAASDFGFKRIEGITQHKIKTDLSPMIRGTERFDLPAAQKRVSGFLHENIILTEKETLFIQRFSAGYYEPSLLFENNEVLERITTHPMAAWRIRHIREGIQDR